LGIPDIAENPTFQRRVLLKALQLLEAPEGPLLVDFPEEAPEDAVGSDKHMESWSCPVSFASEMKEETDPERLRSAFDREVAELLPWYDLNVEKHGRTAVVEFEPRSASELIGAFGTGGQPVIPKADISLATALRLAAQDLKAFYFEAVTARPGSAPPSIGEFSRWFWQETAAGRMLRAVKERCLKSEDPSLKMTGAMFLIPMDQR
jgi:hypothetical protein